MANFDTHINDWKASDAFRKRPFRFEDLNGAPEPKEWGPLYPNLPSVEKWRRLNRKRELTTEETRSYGAAVGEAIRKLNRPSKYADVPMRCTVQNTCGTDNTSAGEEARYRYYVEVKLPAMKAARKGLTSREDAIDKYLEEAAERHHRPSIAVTPHKPTMSSNPTLGAGAKAWITRRANIAALVSLITEAA